MRWLSRLALMMSLAMGMAAAAEEPTDDTPLRIGLTSVFLNDRAAFLERWQNYLASRLDREVEFVQRGSYREITDRIRQGHLDVAWICGYPYVRHQQAMRLLVVPLFEGEPLYRSYLIVPADDETTDSIEDLQGEVFAFSDPDSNSGYLYRRYQLKRLGFDSEDFFRRTFFAHAHSNVVEAVAAGLADGGSVDSYVWETLRLHRPELVERTRVASRSPQFGHPPFVARRGLASETRAAVREALLGMSDTARGKELLDELNLDGFSREAPALYEPITAMMHYVRE